MLPPNTAKIWEHLETEPALAGAILVGGAALSLQIEHRTSYDLDFCFREVRLPSRRIDRAIRALSEAGISVQRNDDSGAYDEFLNAGMSLHDYQQDFLTDQGAKLTFFAEDPASALLLAPGAERTPRVATLAEIFALKTLLSAKRSTSRDWFDLYLLMTEYGFSIHQFAAVFQEAKQPLALDIAFKRLCSGSLPPDDPGFESTMKNPPTIDEMRTFFIAARNAYEVETAQNRKEDTSSADENLP